MSEQEQAVADAVDQVEKVYPIAETFVSPQGEGLNTGILMLFVRLAGCSVGKKMTSEDRARLAYGLELPVYTEMCTLWDGRQFCCDTDFRTKEILTPDAIVKRIPEGVQWVCITGGEPLNFDLAPLLAAIWAIGRNVQIETSGTVAFDRGDFYSRERRMLWLTVSPKFGVLQNMLREANELKLLVDENFDVEKATQLVNSSPHSSERIVFLQPVNFENEINAVNLQRCVEIQKLRPSWRISCQLHKVMRVR